MQRPPLQKQPTPLCDRCGRSFHTVY
jgi:hypothetical protein